ncbi:hypothetical protein BKA64DRAFT_638938 [Cadophora sp. MPI-SDFR-AT-0126]|nr:hypothetical protein BKA64DRAFT_638938 [Leotiomycetes sp. MPI-SDFR-AT-0126]
MWPMYLSLMFLPRCKPDLRSIRPQKEDKGTVSIFSNIGLLCLIELTTPRALSKLLQNVVKTIGKGICHTLSSGKTFQISLYRRCCSHNYHVLMATAIKSLDSHGQTLHKWANIGFMGASHGPVTTQKAGTAGQSGFVRRRLWGPQAEQSSIGRAQADGPSMEQPLADMSRAVRGALMPPGFEHTVVAFGNIPGSFCMTWQSGQGCGLMRAQLYVGLML